MKTSNIIASDPFIMADGSWGDANQEVSSFARSANDYLTDALEQMTEPHAATEGCTVLKALLDAQNSLKSAIDTYLEDCRLDSATQAKEAKEANVGK